MASTSYASSVTSGEMAAMVSDYLLSEGFSRTHQQFQQEAAGLLRNGGRASVRRSLRLGPQDASGLKPLRGVLSEWVGLTEERDSRKAMRASHPLVARIVGVLEDYAREVQSHHHDGTG